MTPDPNEWLGDPTHLVNQLDGYGRHRVIEALLDDGYPRRAAAIVFANVLDHLQETSRDDRAHLMMYVFTIDLNDRWLRRHLEDHHPELYKELRTDVQPLGEFTEGEA